MAIGTNDVNSDEKDVKGLMQLPPSGPASPRDGKEDWIGRQLRRVFDDTLNEPLPQDIMSLLEQLDEQPAEQAPANGLRGGSGSAPDSHSGA